MTQTADLDDSFCNCTSIFSCLKYVLMYLLLQELQRILCQMRRVQKHQLEKKAVTGGRNTGLQQNADSSDNNWSFRDSMLK